MRYHHAEEACRRKEPLTEKEARAVARNSRKNRNGLRVEAYRCKFCGHWHTGKTPKKPVRVYRPPEES